MLRLLRRLSQPLLRLVRLDRRRLQLLQLLMQQRGLCSLVRRVLLRIMQRGGSLAVPSSGSRKLLPQACSLCSRVCQRLLLPLLLLMQQRTLRGLVGKLLLQMVPLCLHLLQPLLQLGSSRPRSPTTGRRRRSARLLLQLALQGGNLLCRCPCTLLCCRGGSLRISQLRQQVLPLLLHAP